MLIKLACITLAIFISASPGLAKDLRKVKTVGPAWATFTNKDGSGLYHEVLRMVFSLYDVTVVHEYVPTDRADEMVKLGQADIMTCDDRTQPPLVTGRYPLFHNDFHVLYDKSKVRHWTGPESLYDKDIAIQQAFYHHWDFPVPVHFSQMPSGVRCFEMVLLGRADFYVDDIVFIRDSMEKTAMPFDPEDYLIRRAGSRSYYPLFNKTPRGQKVKKLYEEGLMRLHKAGKLKPVYDKWGHAYPDFDSNLYRN